MDNFSISVTTVKRYLRESLEQGILCEDIRPLFDGMSKEAKSIWYYAFTEMMNNAIEHSDGRVSDVW